MDPIRFDRFTRALGTGQSRRSILKSLTGGAVGAALAVVGIGDAAAAIRKRSVGNSCNFNSDCASNLCVQESRTRKICHCASASDCPAVTTQCHTAACLPTGYCGAAITPGAACDDGNACTQTDVCQPDGSCLGSPVTCPAPGVCQVAGVCDPSTGLCALSSTAAANGSVCLFAYNHFANAEGECEGGVCVCKPAGGPCNCSDVDSIAGCCSGGCLCAGTCL